MKKLLILCHQTPAGSLTYDHHSYTFQYLENYNGPAISLTLPVQIQPYTFEHFPSFFDGLLPEGIQLEGLLRIHKLDRTDYMGQLQAVGNDFIGAITIQDDPSEQS